MHPYSDQNKYICAYVTTRGRTDTTLALSIMSILNQTRKVNEIVVLDDNPEPIGDPRSHVVLQYIIRYAEEHGIPWKFIPMRGRSAVLNHIYALENFPCDYLFRFDDDVYYNPNVIEELEKSMGRDVACAAPLVLFNRANSEMVGNLNKNLLFGLNAGVYQWFLHPTDDLLEVESLYSTFLIDREKALQSDGYPTELSPVGFFEEAVFSHNVFRAGFKLVINPKAISYHFFQPHGGIRTEGYGAEMYAHDLQWIYNKMKNDWGYYPHKYNNEVHYCLLGAGIQDEAIFLSNIDSIKKCFPGWRIVIASDNLSLYVGREDITSCSIRDYIFHYPGLELNKWNFYLDKGSKDLFTHIKEKYSDGKGACQILRYF